ncbi:MAG TPA: pyridoxamine 5'-phosphate oxidase family protein [Chloroflexota bacterium]|nr:pyridoxamine 5'-phosphate oxidase family protein [Chloroflexota bacterium]
MSTRTQAAEAYVKALRTGEPSATQQASQYLADDVVLATAQGEVSGHDNVLQRITGQWPLTPVFQLTGFSPPREEGDTVKVDAELPPLGAAPRSLSLTFSFNGGDKIKRVEQKQEAPPPQPPTDTIPSFVRGIINGALANGTPMVVAYTDEDGQPVLSLRGSVQVYSDTQLCIWVRNADGGIVKTMTRNPRLSLLYRDSKTRTTLIVQGKGHVETSPEIRERVFQLSPEVEQNHDTGRKGAALIIDIASLGGSTVRGGIKVAPGGA